MAVYDVYTEAGAKAMGLPPTNTANIHRSILHPLNNPNLKTTGFAVRL